MIIGLTGGPAEARLTIAQILVTAHHYEQRAIADRVCDAMLAIDPWLGDGSRLTATIDMLGWKRALKTNEELRRLVRRYGTTVTALAGEDVWLNATIHDLHGGENVVITDISHPRQANAICALAGVIWRVAPGSAAPHPAEADMAGYPADANITSVLPDLVWDVAEHLDGTRRV